MKIEEPRQTFVAPPGRQPAPSGFALFNLGFRPFYLAGAACAALALYVAAYALPLLRPRADGKPG